MRDERVNAQSASHVELTWHADPECPDRAWAEARLQERGASSTTASAPRTLRVEAHLTREPHGFRLVLSSERAGERGERVLTGKSCDELAQAAVLIIALALAEEHPPDTTPTPAPPTPPPPESSPLPSPPNPPPRDDGPRQTPASTRLTVRGAATVDIGFLPEPSIGPEVALGFGGTRFQGELGGFWLPERETGPSARGRVGVSLWALRPAGCARLWEGRFALDVCLGLEFGRVRAEGRALNGLRQRHWLYRSAWGCLRFSAQVGRAWAFSLEPGVAIPLGRHRFVSESPEAEQPSELHTPAAASARLTLALSKRF